jgi:hypothetical protein
LLDPEKPGSWNIAVEAKRDRELVPVAVITALGFTALWVQAGAFLAGAAAVLFGFSLSSAAVDEAHAVGDMF